MRSAAPLTPPSLSPSASRSAWALAVALGLALAAGCAKQPTDVLTQIDVDPTVPPLLILRVTVTSPTAGQSTGALRSTADGDAADRPLPFAFPLLVPVDTDPSFAGPVTISVDGLDWDTHAVIASGSTDATVVAGQETHAELTLFPVRGAGGEAGADGGAPDGGDAAGSD